MSFFARLASALTPMDTTEACEAIAEAKRSQRDLSIRARAIRMDARCPNAVAQARVIGAKIAGAIGWTPEPTPPDMDDLLRRIR